MAIIPQIYEDAVVAIGVKNPRGTIWIATGFIVARENENGGYNTFLVSNRHVLDGGFKNLVVRFNFAGDLSAKDYEINMIDDANQKRFSVHTDARVDVACMFINPNVLQRDLGGLCAFTLDQFALSRNEMLENEVIEGTIVYSLGFPSGLVGIDSKVPLCRMGCISKIKEPINGKGYIVDTQNFPGSSGSPIINRLESNCLTGTKSYNRTQLVGIIASYIPYEDELISKQTGKVMQKTQENSGLAIVYDVDAIKETVEIEFDRIRQITETVKANATDPLVEDDKNET